MNNKYGINIEPGKFYVDGFRQICYVERHESSGELVYSDLTNPSPMTLGGYADLLIAEIKDPEEQIKFISRTFKRIGKQGKLEASAQSLPLCTDEPLQAGGSHPNRKDGPYQNGPGKKYSEETLSLLHAAHDLGVVPESPGQSSPSSTDDEDFARNNRNVL
ncbi:MAG: hypothetical protein Q7R52_04810 [archaeon]|nr:hypothetical protein [archaeon]